MTISANNSIFHQRGEIRRIEKLIAPCSSSDMLQMINDLTRNSLKYEDNCTSVLWKVPSIHFNLTHYMSNPLTSDSIGSKGPPLRGSALPVVTRVNANVVCASVAGCTRFRLIQKHAEGMVAFSHHHKNM